MRIRPVRLNAAIASLFMLGSACFVLGSVPAYINAIGGFADGVTYFIGSIFFTTASFLQLVQAQTPSMTDTDEAHQNTPEPVRMWRCLPHDRSWLAAITQFPGTLFFNVSTLVALARNASVEQMDRPVWRPDFFGSTLFLVASNANLLAEKLQSLGQFELIGADEEQLPLVAFRLASDDGYDEFDLAWQLPAERGWMVPAYTLPPNAQDVTIMRALVKETLSREHVETLARDIEEACGTLAKKGGAHESERQKILIGPGH